MSPVHVNEARTVHTEMQAEFGKAQLPKHFGLVCLS